MKRKFTNAVLLSAIALFASASFAGETKFNKQAISLELNESLQNELALIDLPSVSVEIDQLLADQKLKNKARLYLASMHSNAEDDSALEAQTED